MRNLKKNWEKKQIWFGVESVVFVLVSTFKCNELIANIDSGGEYLNVTNILDVFSLRKQFY